MSKLELTAQVTLLKEAEKYFKDVKPVDDVNLEKKEGGITLTEDHIFAWLEVFYEDRIRMDTCNQASVRM